MRSFSNSVVAVAGFASNFLFWRKSGYFDPAAGLKPLLHTWSLAVEEQYYLLLPLLLLVLLKLGRRWTIGLLAAAAIASLAAAHIGSKSYPAFTFYMLPTRGWELLIAVLIALRPSGSGQRPMPRIASEVAGFAGLALIDYLCNERGCLTYIGNDRKLGITSRDYGHLTPFASDAFARDVLVPLILNRSRNLKS